MCTWTHSVSERYEKRESIVLKFLPLLVGMTAVNFILVTRNVISLASSLKRSKHYISQAMFKKDKSAASQERRSYTHSEERAL